jgi:hypothetical protein
LGEVVAVSKSKRNSTATVTPSGTIVPWLAASGELAYSPDRPPTRRYHFQYSWHMPNAFEDRKEHRYFGYSQSLSDDWHGRVGVLSKFWKSATDGRQRPVFVYEGKRFDEGFLAPIACYDHQGEWPYDTGYVLIQQGSYQLIAHKEQPLMQQGDLCIYRGIGKAEAFNLVDITGVEVDGQLLIGYWQAMERSFSDSEVAFQVAHSFVKRSETGFLADKLSWHDIAEGCGLPPSGDGLDAKLVNFHCESFSLSKHLATVKFGPNYIGFSTPATNVRLTSLFAGEYEVNVIDPRKLTFLESNGCDLRCVVVGESSSCRFSGVGTQGEGRSSRLGTLEQGRPQEGSWRRHDGG